MFKSSLDYIFVHFPNSLILNGKVNNIYRFYVFALLYVVLEVHSIVTVLQTVRCNTVIVVVSSLCCYTCHVGFLNSKVNLEPLISVFYCRLPSPFMLCSRLHI